MTFFVGNFPLRALTAPTRGHATLAGDRDQRCAPRRRLASIPNWAGTRALLRVICLSCLANCTGPQLPPAGAVSSRAPSDADVAVATFTAARKQRWNCEQIERAISNLIAAMQEAKARAEAYEQQVAPTLSQMFARMSGPPGAGNPALAEFQRAHRDAEQLNNLLRDKGCATHAITVAPPRLSKR